MISWLRRRKKNGGTKKRSSRLPKRELAPIEELVDQEITVAEVAIRMTVKNEIIMNALGKHLDYDEKQVENLVRVTTQALAAERDNDAEHLDNVITGIQRRGSYRYSDSSYSGGDKSTLAHRQEVYMVVALRLRELAEDEEFLRRNAARARDLAWRDISASIAAKADHPYYAGENAAGYDAERQSRIDEFIANDLAALAKNTAKNGGKNGAKSATKGAANNVAKSAGKNAVKSAGKSAKKGAGKGAENGKISAEKAPKSFLD